MKKTFMIYLLPAIVGVAGLAGCQLQGVSPTTKTNEDTSIYHETFVTSDQTVMTSVNNTTLTMVYNEDISLIFGAIGYDQSYAVHLYEDFNSSLLHGFDYTTVNAGGDVTFNWVDNNLNNVTLKTVTDTTINGKAMVKVNVKRPFTFVKTYADVQSALDEQQILLNRTADKVNFSSNIYFGSNFQNYTTSAKIVYKSQTVK
ncbi:hypothetical protein [Mucilaginibacter sp. UR6-11]|uniref:hypothetical protein n=1 Tax=Mucilaginibacter sp. UR6-11 TaxID=1435644 RepID=UPI001E587412|nr:hypothetical protein [Mucilaginibacter sp. UR6-11]MCC8425277.1 hypothetical protein [Mucilaginibacter sp. UR6-11]